MIGQRVWLTLVALGACSGPQRSTAAGGAGQDASVDLADTGAIAAPDVDAAINGAPDTVAAPGACVARSLDRVCLAAGISQFGVAAPEAHFELRPPRAARLRAFEIDAVEVTAIAYAQCVAAGACSAPQCADGSASVSDGAARCVAWSDARAYCTALHGRLPTEAEWERASAGLLPDHRAYPWGDDAGEPDAWMTPDANAGPGDRTPEGVRDLGGGVAEWVDDVGAFYPAAVRRDAGNGVASGDAATDVADDENDNDGEDAGPEWLPDSALAVVDDPRGPSRGAWRVVRGGDDHEPIGRWTTTRRRFRLAGDRQTWIGFRCAYDREPRATATPDFAD